MGTAPFSITMRVWSDVPDATFVKAHAASNCSSNAHVSDSLQGQNEKRNIPRSCLRQSHCMPEAAESLIAAETAQSEG